MSTDTCTAIAARLDDITFCLLVLACAAVFSTILFAYRGARR